MERSIYLVCITCTTVPNQAMELTASRRTPTFSHDFHPFIRCGARSRPQQLIFFSLGLSLCLRFGSLINEIDRTVAAREGYSRWAATYEDTIKHDMDSWLLDQLQTVVWNRVELC